MFSTRVNESHHKTWKGNRGPRVALTTLANLKANS